MDPLTAYLLPLGVALVLAGSWLAWRRLDRQQREDCKVLAQDLSDKVHDRCDAYRRLEARINALIAEYDHREAELRGNVAVTESAVAPAAAVAPVAPVAPAAPACAETEACETACRSLSADSTKTSSSASGIERVLEALTRQIHELRLAQRSAEAARTPVAPAPAKTPSPLDLIQDRIERLERQLVVWPGPYAGFGIGGVHPGLVGHLHPVACPQCARARELARQILELGGPAVLPLAQPTSVAPAAPVAPAVDLSTKLAEARQRMAAEMQQRVAEKERELDRAQDSYQRVVDENRRIRSELAERERRLSQVQVQVEGMRGDISTAGQLLESNRSQITELMRMLEVTQGETASHQRRLDEQGAQYSAAYSLLGRLGPLVHAMEGQLTTAPGKPAVSADPASR